MKILYMGTPEFALFALKELLKGGHEIAAVVSQPDKPKGRGYVMTPPPVAQFAKENNIPLYQPQTLKDFAFEKELKEINPEVIVVVAYGKILPAYVLDFPKYGCINIHGSLLPKYRGAAPMQRAVMNGEKFTGVTTMYMADGIDTGDMLISRRVEILPDDNFEDVHDKLGIAGAQAIIETLDKIKDGSIVRIPQDDSEATHAAKIEKSECCLDFSKSCEELHNQIRGLSPFPLCFTHLANKKLIKIVRAKALRDDGAKNLAHGYVADTKDGIKVACRDGYIVFLSVVPEGKKQMSAEDFVRGRGVCAGEILGE